jgi:hypothetical protein
MHTAAAGDFRGSVAAPVVHHEVLDLIYTADVPG